MLSLNCKKGAAKAILPQSCWGEGTAPVPMFLQPAAVLQNHPRKEETRAKGREARRVLPAIKYRHRGPQEANTLLCWGLPCPHPKSALTGLMTGASTAASTMHGDLPALRLLPVCLQPWAMTVHLCSLLCPTTLPAPGLALPARGQCMALSLSALGLFPIWQGGGPGWLG